MQDLGTLPGDGDSAGLGMNDRGEVVGASINGSGASGSPRAFLWQNGGMTDLNAFIPGSPSWLCSLPFLSIPARRS
jgi:probable HAF family extracellular repeat protein